MTWTHTHTDVLCCTFWNFSMNQWVFRLAIRQISVWLLAWQSQEIPYREHSWWTSCSCTHLQHTHTHPSYLLMLRIIMHDPLPLSYMGTLTHPNTSGKGLLHDSMTGCQRINLVHAHPPYPWFPIGQLAGSILLCLCFHQHGTQTTLNFSL